MASTFFFSQYIDMLLYCGPFMILLLPLLPIVLALMKGVNLLVKWPGYLGSPKGSHLKDPKLTNRPCIRLVAGDAWCHHKLNRN